MNVIKLTAPSAWASYLINGDDSGIDANDKREADEWIAGEAMGPPVSCEDIGFMSYHDASWVCHYAADCQTYTFLVASTNPPEYWLDGTATGIGMRATDKGRIDSLIAMTQGDRRDALIMDARTARRVKGYDGFPYVAGDRVELSPHLDLWMQGARTGVVTFIALTPFERVKVRSDHPKVRKLITATADCFRKV